MQFDDAKVQAAMRVAFKTLENEGIQDCLIGTAGLAAYGLVTDFPDIDIVVERPPVCGWKEDYDNAHVVHFNVANPEAEQNFEVQFISADDDVARFYPVKDIQVIDGIPVAPLLYILQLKKGSDRPKDRLFFAERPDLDALLA